MGAQPEGVRGSRESQSRDRRKHSPLRHSPSPPGRNRIGRRRR
jgi:hypothetical protein